MLTGVDEPSTGAATLADDQSSLARTQRWAEAGTVAVAWFLGSLVFFWDQWSSGFNKIQGDPGAARFIMYINENWYQALLGHASWKNPAFFSPETNSLGRSDTFLLWQVFYIPLRVFGADTFLAYQLTLVLLTLLGFVTFYLLVRTLWRPPIAVGVVGALLFAFASNLATHSTNSSLFGVMLLPSLGLLAVATWRATAARSWTAVAYGAGLGALWSLELTTTFDTTYFALVAASVGVVLCVLVAPRAASSLIVERLRWGWRVVVAVLVGAAVGAIPLLVVFLPIYRSTAGYGLGEVTYFQAHVNDLLDFGTNNLLWSSALHHFIPLSSPAPRERDYMVTPILVLSMLVGAVFVTVRERRAPRPPGGRRFVVAVLASTAVVLLLLPIRTAIGLPWSAIYHLPGASGIRAIDRIGIVANAVVALALVAVAVRVAPLITAPRRRVAYAVAGALALLLCIEQVNTGIPFELNRQHQLAALASYPAPPSSCKRFYVTTTHGTEAQFAFIQTTAMLLSQRDRIPTLNGTSGSFPNGWNLFFPMDVGYQANVASWATKHHVLVGLCALDLDDKTWSAAPT